MFNLYSLNLYNLIFFYFNFFYFYFYINSYMSNRFVSLNTSLIHINEMSAYNNTDKIDLRNSIDITGNTTIQYNLTIAGIDEITDNNNIVDNEITYSLNKIENGYLTINNNNAITVLNLYIGNTYIFDHSNFSHDSFGIILSKTKLKYNPSVYSKADPYTDDLYSTGVSYFYDDEYNEDDHKDRKKIKFIPIQRGVFYLNMSTTNNTYFRPITINVLDNIYKYGSFITNSGFGLTKSLNVAGNMNVKDGMLYVVNRSVGIGSIGIGTTKPRIGFDMINLPNYTDALKLPHTREIDITQGLDAMVRFEEESRTVQGYFDNDWNTLGELKDKDGDTFAEVEISDERENELEINTNGHKRLTILSNDITLVGIATIHPTATLEINGNLNVMSDNTISGIDFGNDITNDDNYLHVNISNSTKGDKSFDFKTNNGGYKKDIQYDLIKTVNNKTSILENNILHVDGLYKFTNFNDNSIRVNSNTDCSIGGNFNNTVENYSIKTVDSYYNYIIHGDSIETFNSSVNLNIDGDYLYNINNTRYLNIIDNVIETYNTNFNINTTNNINETIHGTVDIEQSNFNFETYKTNYENEIKYNNTSTIKNNFNTFINNDYDINIKGNTTEIYLNNFSKSIKLFYNLDIYGNTHSYTGNTSTLIYKNNLTTDTSGFLNQIININKNTNIVGDINETFNNITKNTHINNTQEIHKNYAFNLNNSYYYNVTANKNITISKNYNTTIHGDACLFTTGSAEDNIFFNSNFDKNVTHNVNKISNLVVYNKYDKYVNLDSIEIFKKDKFNYLWLYGHLYSGPNTISYEKTDIWLTNYIKIVDSTGDSPIIPSDYIFPGTNLQGANEWYIFEKGLSKDTYKILNTYDDSYNSNNDNNDNNSYYIRGPNDDNNYALVHQSTPDIIQYNIKLFIGPRKHQLEYNLTTHYIKIFNIGPKNTNISLFHINNSNILLQQEKSTDITNLGTFETGKFVFVKCISDVSGDESVIGAHGIIIKSKYYIYTQTQNNDNPVSLLSNSNNNELTLKAIDGRDSSCIWTIEAVNQNDSSHNADLYYIYNTMNSVNYYIEFHSTDTSIFLTSTKAPNNMHQHFTFYYYNEHSTNITSTLLTYNGETRPHYLTKDSKYIYSNTNKDLYINNSDSTDTTNFNKLGQGSKGSFLLIYSNTITMPGTGTGVGTFKIFNISTHEYLFNEKSYNWIIESIEEGDNNSHESAIYIIKLYNNGNATRLLKNDNNVLDLSEPLDNDITYPVADTAKFTFENVIIGISPGSFNKTVHKSVKKHVAQIEDISIVGDINETYKSGFNINIGNDLKYDITNLYNTNVYLNNSQTLSKKNTKTILGNLDESIFKNYSKFLKNNYSVSVDLNNSIDIAGSVTEDIHGDVNKTIKKTHKTTILNNTVEEYKQDYTIQSGHNQKTIDGNVIKTILGNSNIGVSKSITVQSDANKTINITKNSNVDIICSKTVNITKNSNVNIIGNKNINIELYKNINIDNNRDIFIGKFNKQETDLSTNINYNKDKTTTISSNAKTDILNDYTFLLNNDSIETNLSNKSNTITEHLTETILGVINLNVNADIALNYASDFNLSCNKNINLDSNGYICITNDIGNNGYLEPSHNKALVVNGGTYIKKDVYIGGDILIQDSFRCLGKDTSSAFETEDFEVNNPIIYIGMLQEDDNTYSGILSKTFIDSNEKFTGIVRNNLNTYALLDNINIDNTYEYSNTDMDNTYENLSVNKHSNFIASRITSHEPNITTHGDMYISKNIFVGILDIPEEHIENSLTLDIGSNINSSQNTLKFISDKDISYNITDNHNINISSSNNYNINILHNRNIYTNNNFVETVNGTYKATKNISNETYKKNYNINISNDHTIKIENDYNNTIIDSNNINFSSSHETVKYDYNLNILENSTTKFNSDHNYYSGNLDENLYSDSTIIIEKNKTLNVHGNCEFNINGTNKLYVVLEDNETYHNTNQIIHKNLNTAIEGNRIKNIKQQYDCTINNVSTEKYSHVTMNTSGSETLKITGDSQTNINESLSRTIYDNITETFKNHNNVIISENLNSIINGSYNINVTNDTFNNFNTNFNRVIKYNDTRTYNKLYNLSVSSYNTEKIGGSNNKLTIIQNYNKSITQDYSYEGGTYKLTINNNATFTNNNNLTSDIHNDSTQTYSKKYNKYINGSVLETYKNYKTLNVLNNYTCNNTSYTQHTFGIGTSTFSDNYDLNLKIDLKETFINDVVRDIGIDNIEKTFKDSDRSILSNKTYRAGSLDSTVNGNINSNISLNYNKNINWNNYIYITGNISQNITGSSYIFQKDLDKNTYKTNSTIYVKNNLKTTYKNALTIIHNTGNNDNTVNTNSILYNNSVYTTINKDYTKNVYMDYNKSIKINLNKTIVGDTIITNNGSFVRTISDNKTKIINKNFIETVSHDVNKTFKENHDITISKNNTYSILQNLNNTIHEDLNETYLSSKFSKNGTNNSNLINYNTDGTVYKRIYDTYRVNVKNDVFETYKTSNEKNILINNNLNINGYYNLNITQSSNEIFNKSFDITQGSNTTLVNNMYSKYIDKNTFETFKSHSTSITNNHNTKYIGGTYNLTSSCNINITTSGNLNITSDLNINKNNNVSFLTRVGINDIVSYTPQIINTQTICNDNIDNITNFLNMTNAYEIIPKTINILYIDIPEPTSTSHLTSLIEDSDHQQLYGSTDIYIRLSLPDAAYNGQIVKIIVHPIFEKTFKDRISAGKVTNIVIRINSFCDTNDNEYVTVDLVLNRGGMGISLIYVDNNITNGTDSYWMLMNNSFIYD